MNRVSTKKISLNSFLIILGIGLGVLLAAQFKSLPIRITDPVVSYSSLKDTKDELYVEQSELKKTIEDLNKSIEEIQKESKNITLSEDEVQALQEKKAIAGLTKISGPGMVITLNDSDDFVNEDSIVHAADLRDVVNLLWTSGAEAISINDQRVVLNTAIDCIVNTILINNQRLSTPYTISAVGPKETLYNAISGGLSGLQKRKHNYGLKFELYKSNNITLPAFNGSFNIKAETSTSG